MEPETDGSKITIDETLEEGTKDLNKAQLCVSHENLMGDQRPLGRSGEETRVEIIVGRRKKSKEKALKEITNKLVTRPIKLKPTWTGPKFSGGANIKEFGNLKRVGPDHSKGDAGVDAWFHFGPSLDSLMGPGEFRYNNFGPPYPMLSNIRTNPLEDSSSGFVRRDEGIWEEFKGMETMDKDQSATRLDSRTGVGRTEMTRSAASSL